MFFILSQKTLIFTFYRLFFTGSYILVTKISIDPYLTLFINAAVFFVIGYMLQKFLFNNILKKENDREPLSVLISTAGLSMVLFSIATMIFGSNAMTAPTKYMGKTIWLGDVMFSVPRTISFVISLSVYTEIRTWPFTACNLSG